MEDLVSFKKGRILKISISLIFLISSTCINSRIILPHHLNQSLTVGETDTFHLFSAHVTENKKEHNLFQHTEVNVTLKTVKIFYKPVTKYIFYNPKIDPNCNCICTEKYNSACRVQDPIKFDKCQFLQNKTATCYNHDWSGYGASFCRRYFRVCCQIFFTASTSQKFHAIKLEKQSTIFELEVSSRDSRGIEQKTTCVVSKTMKRILVNGLLITWNPAFAEADIYGNSWFFKTDSDVSTLRYISTMNEKYERNLRKMGWFQAVNDDMMLSIPQEILDTKFRVHINQCNEKSPTYTWNLDAIMLNLDEKEATPNSSDSFSNIKITNNKVVSYLSNSKIELTVLNPTSPDYFFQAYYITKNGKNKTALFVIMNSSDVHDASIFLNDQTTILKTLFSNKENETAKTFCYELDLPYGDVITLWVCLQNANKTDLPLCRKAEISLNLSNCYEVREKISSPKNSTEENSTYNRNNNTENHEKLTSGPGYVNVLTLTFLTLTLFMLLIGIKFFLIWRKCRKKTYPQKIFHDINEIRPMLLMPRKSDESAEAETFQKIISKQQEKLKELQAKILNDTEINNLLSDEHDLGVAFDTFPLDKNKTDYQATSMEINLIFDQPNLHKIVIEGDVKMWIIKLTVDWIKGQNYISNRFRMVFYFDLDNYVDETIEELVMNVCKELKEDEESGLKLIKANESKILFLFNNYDEMNESSKLKFDDIMKTKGFQKSMIIIANGGKMTDETTEDQNEKSLYALQRSKDDGLLKRILIKKNMTVV